MSQEKAYKLLAIQENISNKMAKDLIDTGLVSVGTRKLRIARALLDIKTQFKIIKRAKIKTIFEDENVLVVNKPAFMVSEDISKKFGLDLLHRLDKETSGVLVMVKSEEFKRLAIKEFKNNRVHKEYIAVVKGLVSEDIDITDPILTIKKNNKAYSSISPHGSEAHTVVSPLMVHAKFSKVKVVIKTGRTHQIRVHLKSASLPVLGDSMYGISAKGVSRVMLHASKMELFDYTLEADEPSEFIQIMR